MMMGRLSGFTLAWLGLLAAAPVVATPYDFSFVSKGVVEASGSLVTGNTLDAAGGYDILSMSGTIFGQSITGLVANPNQPGPYALTVGATGGTDTFDNILFPQANPLLDDDGILVMAGGAYYNLFAGSRDYMLGTGVGTFEDPFSTTEGSFSLTPQGAVPEPGSWALMLCGFVAVGGAMRRQRSFTGRTIASGTSRPISPTVM